MQRTSEALPTLDTLPDPPSGKTGWPWTEQSDLLPETQPNGEPWPRVSIVTPSYNYGQFIEKTIRSVLLQGYPNLEYIVIDGGSNDESVEIIKKYEAWIDFWVSKQDRGQSHAINTGFEQANGMFGGWINSDDWLCKNALVDHANDIGFDKGSLYVGICNAYRDGEQYQAISTGIRSAEDLVRLSDYWGAFYLGYSSTPKYITQPETLFPLEEFFRVGGLNEDNHLTMDYELWGKLLVNGVKLVKTDIEYAVIRRHADQKTEDRESTIKSLVHSAHKIIDENDEWSDDKKQILHQHVDSHYEREQNAEEVRFRNSGRLAKLGLPPWVVHLVRKFKRRIMKDSSE